jgi:hypothetical protein
MQFGDFASEPRQRAKQPQVTGQRKPRKIDLEKFRVAASVDGAPEYTIDVTKGLLPNPEEKPTRPTKWRWTMTSARTNAHPATGASRIVLLAGLWLFVSPWIYGYGSSSAWNSWAIGALIFLFALIRVNRPAATGLSWLNSVLGIWTFVSPWVYGYPGHPGRAINSLFVGLIVFCAAVAGANSERMSHDRTSTV